MKIHSAIDVAKALVALTDPEKGDTTSNLKVQKLLYYAQGVHLALYGKPLFKEEIYSWQYGPVVPEVYAQFKEFGSGAIEYPEGFDFSIFQETSMEVLTEVHAVYGQFSAIKLMNMTHEEPPYNNTKSKSIISHEELYNYFKTQLED